MIRETCNWWVGKCARNLDCEGHCPEYTRHKPHMTRGVSPLEAAFQRAVKEGQDVLEGRKVHKQVRVSEKVAESDKGDYRCPKCGTEKQDDITRLRTDWWHCRRCGWEGRCDDKPLRMSREDF